jgi:hypothetical protein
MAAGMHPSVIARAVRKIGGFLYRQRIHICPETDRTRRSPDPQAADDTRPADAAMDLIAEFRELFCDELGGSLLLEPKLGVSVDVAPPIRQITVKFREAL